MIMIHSPLLRNIKADAFEEMCAFLSAKERQFEKNSTIFHTGDTIHEIGMVITGSIIIEHLDLWGNKSILTNIAAGGIFAEVYALCREPIMVDVIAAEDSRILFFHAEKPSPIRTHYLYHTQNDPRKAPDLFVNAIR